jgi:exopolysaccharide biosynthesis polyprenyl glycosylphosphotransferase
MLDTLHAAEVAPARSRGAAARRRRSFPAVRVAIDALVLAGAVVADDIGSRAAGLPRSPLFALVVFPLLVLVLLGARGLYRPRLRLQLLDDLRCVVMTTSLAAMLLLSLRVLFGPAPYAAGQSVRLWAFATAYLALGRTALSLAETRARKSGEQMRPALIVGAGRVGQLVARRLEHMPELGLRAVGFLDKDPRPDVESELPVLGASWDLEQVLEEHAVEQVIVTFSTAPHDVLLRLARRCQAAGVEVAFVPRLFEGMNERLRVEYLGGLPLVSGKGVSPLGWRFALKYALDRVLALLLLVCLAPLLLLLALLVWRSLGRPIVFRQRRVGRDGLVFPMLKFRTMTAAEAADVDAGLVELPPDTAPGGVEGGIDRRTPLGRFLRRTSLDELPQLVNVLRGEMSLVGPRPERPEYAALFAETVPRYAERHRAKAGVTGWAQINGLRGKTSLADRVEWDNYYIENWSPWLDVKILLTTARAAVVRAAD